jgi:hypothetical protein
VHQRRPRGPHITAFLAPLTLANQTTTIIIPRLSLSLSHSVVHPGFVDRQVSHGQGESPRLDTDGFNSFFDGDSDGSGGAFFGGDGNAKHQDLLTPPFAPENHAGFGGGGSEDHFLSSVDVHPARGDGRKEKRHSPKDSGGQDISEFVSFPSSFASLVGGSEAEDFFGSLSSDEAAATPPTVDDDVRSLRYANEDYGNVDLTAGYRDTSKPTFATEDRRAQPAPRPSPYLSSEAFTAAGERFRQPAPKAPNYFSQADEIAIVKRFNRQRSRPRQKRQHDDAAEAGLRSVFLGGKSPIKVIQPDDFLESTDFWDRADTDDRRSRSQAKKESYPPKPEINYFSGDDRPFHEEVVPENREVARQRDRPAQEDIPEQEKASSFGQSFGSFGPLAGGLTAFASDFVESSWDDDEEPQQQRSGGGIFGGSTGVPGSVFSEPFGYRPKAPDFYADPSPPPEEPRPARVSYQSQHRGRYKPLSDRQEVDSYRPKPIEETRGKVEEEEDEEDEASHEISFSGNPPLQGKADGQEEEFAFAVRPADEDRPRRDPTEHKDPFKKKPSYKSKGQKKKTIEKPPPRPKKKTRPPHPPRPRRPDPTKPPVGGRKHYQAPARSNVDPFAKEKSVSKPTPFTETTTITTTTISPTTTPTTPTAAVTSSSPLVEDDEDDEDEEPLWPQPDFSDEPFRPFAAALAPQTTRPPSAGSAPLGDYRAPIKFLEDDAKQRRAPVIRQWTPSFAPPPPPPSPPPPPPSLSLPQKVLDVLPGDQMSAPKADVTFKLNPSTPAAVKEFYPPAVKEVYTPAELNHDQAAAAPLGPLKKPTLAAGPGHPRRPPPSLGPEGQKRPLPPRRHLPFVKRRRRPFQGLRRAIATAATPNGRRTAELRAKGAQIISQAVATVAADLTESVDESLLQPLGESFKRAGQRHAAAAKRKFGGHKHRRLFSRGGPRKRPTG